MNGDFGDFCNETKQRRSALISIKVECQISDGLCAKQSWDIHERGREGWTPPPKAFIDCASKSSISYQ